MNVAPIKNIKTSREPSGRQPDDDPNKKWRQVCAHGLGKPGQEGRSNCYWTYTLKTPKVKAPKDELKF